MAKGTINGPVRAFKIYDNDQELKAAAWNDIVITYKNGAPVRVRDIGRAIAGPENTLLAAWANGKQAILLDPGRNQPTRPAGTIDRGEAATRGLAGRPCAARGWRSQTSFIAMEHTGVKPMPGM